MARSSPRKRIRRGAGPAKKTTTPPVKKAIIVKRRKTKQDRIAEQFIKTEAKEKESSEEESSEEGFHHAGPLADGYFEKKGFPLQKCCNKVFDARLDLLQHWMSKGCQAFDASARSRKMMIARQFLHDNDEDDLPKQELEKHMLMQERHMKAEITKYRELALNYQKDMRHVFVSMTELMSDTIEPACKSDIC